MSVNELKERVPLLELPGLGLEQITDFSLNLKFYEERMRRLTNEEPIDDSHSVPSPADELLFWELVPQFDFNPEEMREHEGLETIFARNNDITKPVSMEISSIKKLEEHVLKAYQVAYANYMLSRNSEINEIFPHGCSDKFSANVMLSLVDFGYVNAAIVLNTKLNHYYVILPFVSEKKEGVIIVDPTSDSLWRSHWKDMPEKDKPRNMVSVRLGRKWEYKTEFLGGHEYTRTPEEQKDLFPDKVLSLDVMIKHLPDYGFKVSELPIGRYHSTARYLRKAFSNPININ
ncbi:MAG: hypothetical protein U9O94_07460 [Nanoarchaeota archaeon]|nr:hypothetical protein [Nanoarchaeota archaeon]